MASHYLSIFVVFVSTIYLTFAAFLDVSSQLSPHGRITSDVHNSHLHQSITQDHVNGSDDDHPDDRGKKVRFRSRVAYCGTPFCG